jgi:hypothetical protein
MLKAVSAMVGARINYNSKKAEKKKTNASFTKKSSPPTLT